MNNVKQNNVTSFLFRSNWAESGLHLWASKLSFDAHQIWMCFVSLVANFEQKWSARWLSPAEIGENGFQMKSSRCFSEISSLFGVRWNVDSFRSLNLCLKDTHFLVCLPRGDIDAADWALIWNLSRSGRDEKMCLGHKFRIHRTKMEALPFPAKAIFSSYLSPHFDDERRKNGAFFLSGGRPRIEQVQCD